MPCVMTIFQITPDNLVLLYGTNPPLPFYQLRDLATHPNIVLIAAVSGSPTVLHGGVVGVYGDNQITGKREMTLWATYSDGTPGLALRLLRYAERTARGLECRVFIFSKAKERLGNKLSKQQLIIKEL